MNIQKKSKVKDLSLIHTKRLLRIVSVAAVILCSACSLDYFEQGATQSESPEFVFFDANFIRTENNSVSIRMDVEQVEQYDEGGLTFASRPSFTLYDSNEGISVIGFCDILSADTAKEEYAFFGNVSITSYEHDTRVDAESLRWSGSTELFSGAKNEQVSITVGNSLSEPSNINERGTKLHVTGEGFSASALDFSYSFTGPVSGSIIEN